MKLFIPTIGVQLKLLSPTSVNIHFERRNRSLMEQFGIKDVGGWGRNVYQTNDELLKKFGAVRGSGFITVTLPEGSILSVDRIYIRKSAGDYDSITFNLLARKGKEKKSFPYGRFWIKLDEANSLDVEVVKTIEEVKENRQERKEKAIEKELKEHQLSFLRCVALCEKLNEFLVKGQAKIRKLSVRQGSPDYYLFLELNNLKRELGQYLSGNDIAKILADVDKEFK